MAVVNGLLLLYLQLQPHQQHHGDGVSEEILSGNGKKSKSKRREMAVSGE